MAEILLVLGMHRSGTSSVAGVLTKLGGHAPKTPMAPSFANERGFFESQSFMSFHDQLLDSAGSNWVDWRPFNPNWHQTTVAEHFRRRAKDLFTSEFEEVPLPVLKDPRICRFAPFWFDVIKEMGAKSHLVMPIRSPLDVASSISQIFGLSTSHGLLLWLRHVLDAERHSRSTARSIFSWKDFLSDWRGVCEKVAEETNLIWPRYSDRSAVEIDRFLENKLVHHKTTDEALNRNPAVHEWALEAYQVLLELARNPHSNAALATLDEIRQQFDQASHIFGRLLMDYEVDLEDARGVGRQAAAERDALQARQKELLTEFEPRVEAAERERKLALQRANELEETLAAERVRSESLLGRQAALGADLEREREAAAELLAEARRNFCDENRTLLTEVEALKSQLIDADAAHMNLKSNAARRGLIAALAPASLVRFGLAYQVLYTGLFDADYYCGQFPEASSLGARTSARSAATHYLQEGFARGGRPNPLFDSHWYLDRNPDVRKSGMNPLLHFAFYGWRERRDPGPEFSTSHYLDSNPDIRKKGMNPLAHYLKEGRYEGRSPKPTE
jgi:hypothetical protein